MQELRNLKLVPQRSRKLTSAEACLARPSADFDLVKAAWAVASDEAGSVYLRHGLTPAEASEAATTARRRAKRGERA